MDESGPRAVGDDLDAERAVVQDLLITSLPAIIPGVGAEGWPYAIEDGKHREEPSASQSTSAMIGFTLAAILGQLSMPDDLIGEVLSVADLEVSQAEIAGLELGYQSAWAALEKLVAPSIDEAEAPSAGGEAPLHVTTPRQNNAPSSRTKAASSAYFTESSLFGVDDPFTHDWIARLCNSSVGAGLNSVTADKLRARIHESTSEKINEVMFLGPEDFKLKGKSPRRGAKPPDFEFIPHVWPVVRLAYLARSAGFRQKLDTFDDTAARFFTVEMAQQLGFADVRDSAFDIARLIFALDGLTLCKPGAVYAGLLSRVLDTVINSQKLDPRLQPRRPFKVTRTGGVHIPISVEVYLSIIRLVRRLPAKHEQAEALGRLLPVLRRYTEYLKASSVDVRVAGEDVLLRGWASDHEFAASSKIETWYSSQVILYLAMYGTLLREYSARIHLADLQLQPRLVPRQIDNFFGQSDVLEQLDEDFSLQDLAHRERWSLLLYGPPGTGKTTVVEQMAQRLGWPLLELSPSHFVDRGVDRVEERASQLFGALRRQTGLVVLFDEIDRLVLNRSSSEYGRQDDMFQFMTPSMLTKLNDLRRKERVVFAIATNYAWRIDSAILRPGRVDQNYLVLPPDARARRAQITHAAGGAVPPRVLDVLARETVLGSWTEIAAFCKLIKRRIRSFSVDEALDACNSFSPTIQFPSYDRELKLRVSGKPAEYLFHELVGLYDLVLESEKLVEVRKKHREFILEANSEIKADIVLAARAKRVVEWMS